MKKDDDRKAEMKTIFEAELNGMPERDDCGRSAQELFDVLAKIEQCAIDKRNATERLVQALKRAKRAHVKVKDKTFVLEHLEEADVIKIKKK